MASEEEKKTHKDKTEELLKSFKVGSTDLNGLLIENIFARGDEYIVYQVKSIKIENSIKIYIDSLVLDVTSKLEAEYDKIRIDYNEVKQHLYKVVDKDAILARLAHILVHGLKVSDDEARTKFKELINEIDSEHKEQYKNRFKLIGGAGLVFLSLIVLCYFLCIQNTIQLCGWTEEIIFAGAAGSFGGFFSILIGVRRLRCEPGVYKWTYYLYGVIRMFIAILAAIIIYFAIKINLIFGFCNDLESKEIGYFIFGILAGFSESLVPNFLSKLENENNS